MLFQCFASGSDGNCYYIGDYTRGVLIDAGIGIRMIRQNLRALGLDLHNIMGVLVTHDHTDHVRTVSVLANKHHIPIYATEKVHAGIDHNPRVHPKIDSSCRRTIQKDVPFEICGLSVQPFGVAHDSADCVGYSIRGEGWTMTLATDIGHVSDHLAEHIRQSNIVIVEANYDPAMLENGPYPFHLKERIRSGSGHLANDECGRLLAENYHSGLKQIFLCHLSQMNNKPDTAYATVCQRLTEAGVQVGTDVEVAPLARLRPSKLIQLETLSMSTH